MVRKVFIVLMSIVLLHSLGIQQALSQGQSPPMVPPRFIWGNSSIDGVPLGQSDSAVISMRMEKLLILFYDSVDYQDDIESIVTGLNSDNTAALGSAFTVSEYCQNYDPPIVLSGSAAVNKISDNEWRVMDIGRLYSVIREAVQIWDGGWTGGWKLEVYLHNAVIVSYTLGEKPIDEYFLEIPVDSGDVLWGNNTYVLREPGNAKVGDKADILINGIRIDKINNTPVDPLPYTVGLQSYESLNINSPSLYTVNIPLAIGWNMFSIPVQTLSTDPSQVLSTIANAYDSVWAFNPGSGWLIYKPGSPSNLQEIKPCEGYWIKMDTPGLLTVEGTDPDITEIFLEGGQWNLVGYCSRQLMSVADAVSSITSSIDSVWQFKPDQGWLIYTPGSPSNLEFLNPGDAVWIKADVDCLWDVNQ